jgi:hypothetical protein
VVLSRLIVMSGFIPGIHVLSDVGGKQDVDGRDKPGHDCGGRFISIGHHRACPGDDRLLGHCLTKRDGRGKPGHDVESHNIS